MLPHPLRHFHRIPPTISHHHPQSQEDLVLGGPRHPVPWARHLVVQYCPRSVPTVDLVALAAVAAGLVALVVVAMTASSSHPVLPLRSEMAVLVVVRVCLDAGGQLA